MSTYEISKSSLLSLKAEILRKQEELSKIKSENNVKLRNLKKTVPLEIKNKGVEQRGKQDLTEEEEDLLKKSKSALEAKSKLYDKLSKNKTNLSEEEIEFNRRYLVRFDAKKPSDLPPEFDENDVDRYSESDEDIQTSYDPPANEDEEWVEYVDCLGRTRTCLRKDLEYLKSKDKDLESIVDSKRQSKREKSRSRSSSPEPGPRAPTPELTEENELLSSDMRREILRRQWEKEEEELRNKSNIHYQDILFNEARSHGVGYYGFSKDEEERAKQQEALKKLRDETKEQQKRSQDLKAQREKQLAARIKAAKNRKRERLGLPPEEDEPEPAPEPEKPKEIEEKVDAKEKEKEEKRKQHVRPWDRHKEGVKEHYEYSQEEWVDKKRKERPSEFAPPTAYKREFRSKANPDVEVSLKKTLNFSTKKDFHLQTSKKSSFYKTEETRSMQPNPIINEVDDDDDDSLIADYSLITEINKNTSSERGRGVEIAPPSTFEYYGPSSSKKSKPETNRSNIGDSIDAGLKFLREQMEKKQSSSKKSEDMFFS